MNDSLTLIPLESPLKGLRLIGELDLATAPALKAAFDELPARGSVTLDLTELTFIDSSGLHAIMQFAPSLNGDGPLTLANPSAHVSRLLEIVHMDSHPGIRIS
jgi:anti-sigma B factor antagonist